MLDARQKTSLISRRVQALNFHPSVFKEATGIVTRAGIKLQEATQELWREWLNDMVATENNEEYRLAVRDPGLHFLNWLKVRATRRFHVTWRALEALSRTYGPDVSTRFMIVWQQEVAWAQRMRLFDNPHVAVRAALFLRETEGNPSKTFLALSEIYAQAASQFGYFDNPAQEMSPEEIRFAAELPEFSPLFLQYAAKAYKTTLEAFDRQKIRLLADRAKQDELLERDLEVARDIAQLTRTFPMRRVMAVIKAAIGHGVGPNRLFLIENAYVDKVERGEIQIDRGTRTPQTDFLSVLADKKRRAVLLSASVAPPDDEPDREAARFEIARLNRGWLDGLPDAYRTRPDLEERMRRWQVDIVDMNRLVPYDRISDFGFFVATEEREAANV
jgi:hypothetical protein